MSEPHDHHYVPQFFLAQWSNVDGKIAVYSRPHGDVVVSELTPRSTAFERDLYAYQGLSPEETQIVEKKFMRRVDDSAAPIIHKLLKSGFRDVSARERYDLTIFVLSLRARHPDAVALSRSEGEKKLNAELDRNPDQYLAVKGSEPAETLREFVELTLPHVVPNFGMSLIPKVIANTEVARRVFGMEWSLLDSRKATFDLLTSDRACILEGDAVEGQCIIVLPLAPRKLLVISNDIGRAERLSRLRSNDLVKMVNRAVVTYARKYVYGTGGHHRQFVEKYLGVKQPM